MGVAKKLRVLCMHGYRTNAKIMEDQTRGLRKALAPHAEFVFLNGPIEARGPSDDVIEKLYADNKPFYEWGSFVERERPHRLDPETQEIEYLDGGWYHDYVDWDTTVKYMDEQLPKLGPFDAVVGFSQGAQTMTALTMWYLHHHNKRWWKCCVSVCGPRVRGAALRPLFENPDGTKKLIPMPSVHIVGKTDKWRSGCYEMVDMYENQPEGAARDKFVSSTTQATGFPVESDTNSSTKTWRRSFARTHQTRLLYRNTWRVDAANRIFGACYDGNTVVIINPGRSPAKPYIRVPEGTYGLVQHQGRDVDYVKPDGSRSPVWPPGMHFASVFTKVAHLVTKQYIVFDTPVKGCKTADDVTVGIDMCLILRIMGDESKGEDPELVRRFVYELGPNGLEVQLRAAQDEAVRALARSVEHTEVYQLRDGTMRERFKTGALNFRTNRPVNDEFNSPKIKETEESLPEGKNQAQLERPVQHVRRADHQCCHHQRHASSGVPEADGGRTTHLSAIKEQNMKQMSDMQMLQYKEEIDTTKLKRRMMFMEEEQTGKAKCAEIRKGIDLINAQTKLADDEINQKTAVICNNRDVEAALKIAEIEAETVRIAAEINAHCDAEIGLVNAEKAALQMQLEATTDEVRVASESKAAEIIARAEGAAVKKLEKYREHVLEMKKLDMLGSLAKNKKTVVSGDTSNSLLSEVLWRIVK
ncbi:Alpha/Beta hydrolase fold [Phytophthora cactorum]|nr:Alpha/Beta hydrolase fold [Phytophthora cactorum]